MKKFLPLFFVTWIGGCREAKQHATTDLSDLAYTKGDSLLGRKNDSAFYYFNEAADLSGNYLQKARAYNRMAAIQFAAADYYGSQETITLSQELLDENKEEDRPYLLSNYNLLARGYLEQKNYPAAVTAFEKAASLQAKGKFNATLQNNLAVAYQRIQDYRKAKSLFQQAIDSSKRDTLVYARALSNLARTKWLEDPAYPAATELLTALHLRAIKKDRGGMKTSYSHLADYYQPVRPDSSLYYSREMYRVAETADDTLEAIRKITRVGSPEEAKDYSSLYYRLNDSLRQVRNTSASQFAMIRYEAEKNKSDNLRLQKDNFKQRVYLYTTVVVFALLFFLGFIWYRRRKRRIEQHTRQEIREHQLKTSKKVHDVVANGLYGIMADLEHRETLDKEQLLDKIELLYEQSRDISYDRPTKYVGTYSDHITRLLGSFGSGSTKIFIAGNQESLWKRISAHQKTESEHVLTEIMVNMSKHSGAKKVAVTFSEDSEKLHIHYQDDGVGLSPAFSFGNGLANTENRILGMGGTIKFDGSNGLMIDISLPLLHDI